MLNCRTAFLICLLFFTHALCAHSNLIILGDSLSDNGNYPQGSHLYEKRYADIAQYAYIPATNPINTSQDNTIIIEGREYPYPLPKHPAYLLPMTSLDGQAREFRSVNWTDYLTRQLFDEEHQMIPRRMKSFGVDLYGKNKSINYAFWAAVTSKGCHDDEYHLKSLNCHFERIFKSGLSSNISQILIPGIITQAELIKADIKTQAIYTDNNTLYILYAGGNGLYQAQTEWGEKSLKHLWQAFKLIHGSGAKDIVMAMDALRQPPVNAKHFLILNQYDLSYTPRLLTDTNLTIVTHLFTKVFNKRLKNELALYQKAHPKADIKLFDTETFFSRWAESDFFKPSLGKQCDRLDPKSAYYQKETLSSNCFINKKHGFLFWNNSHPSGLFHALLASELAFFLNQTTLT